MSTLAPFPPRHLVTNSTPLHEWLSDLAGWFLDLESDRGLFVARILEDIAADAKYCTTPGHELTVEGFLDRRAAISDDMPPIPGYPDTMVPRACWEA